MKSRGRILKALNHEETDRVPRDFGATLSSGISWIAYERLKEHLQIPGLQNKTRIIDIVQMLAKPDEQVIEKLGSDTIGLFSEPQSWKEYIFANKYFKNKAVEVPQKAVLETLQNGDNILSNTSGIKVSRLPKNSYYFEPIYFPLRDLNSEEELRNCKSVFENTDAPYFMDESWEVFRKRAQRLHTDTDYAVVGNIALHLYAAAQNQRGIENYFIDLALNKRLAGKILEKQVEAYIPRIDRYIREVGQFIDVMYVMDDLGMQTGTQLSMETYRQVVKPHQKKLWNYIREKSKKPLLLHSCGSVYDLIPDLIEMGVDALNPIQLSAAKMDTAGLKKEFGKYITFWGGGCDTQKILPFGSPEDVRAEVKKRVRELTFCGSVCEGPGNDGFDTNGHSSIGGFVFCQVHNIQPDVPAENIIAMYEALGTIDDTKANNT